MRNTPEEKFIDCVMEVRAQLSLVLDEINPEALRLAEDCAEMLTDAVDKYKLEQKAHCVHLGGDSI